MANKKVCVYTIAKDEEANVDRFVEGALEADYIVILDTGSKDKTIEKFKKYDKVIISQKIFEPFDFGKARNEALSLVPEDVDICISIDLDESMEKGWRRALEEKWTDKTIMGSYWYWSKLDDNGNPTIECWRTKIHGRKGFRWKRSIHEMIVTDLDGEHIYIEDFVVKHHRVHCSNYEKYLDEFIKENPDNSEAYLQRGGDRMDAKEFDKALKDNLKYLELTEHSSDELVKVRRAIVCISIAKCLKALNREIYEIIQYLLKAVSEKPDYRDAWVYLADTFRGIGDFPLAYGCAMRALSITENGLAPKEAICWGDYPKQIANISLREILKKYEVS